MEVPWNPRRVIVFQGKSQGRLETKNITELIESRDFFLTNTYHYNQAFSSHFPLIPQSNVDCNYSRDNVTNLQKKLKILGSSLSIKSFVNIEN